MHRFRMPRLPVVTVVTLALVLGLILPVLASSTPKQLSTNFTLVNLGTGQATGAIKYYTLTGSQWKADDNFTIDTQGGQAIYRQYDQTDLPQGQGSVVVSANQPMGAVVQIQARGQVDTSGAYSGASATSGTYYVPLAARKLGTASGEANSQIIVQNTGTSQINVSVALINGANGQTTYTKTFNGLAPSASVEYDLNDESASNVPDGWYGSAVVESTTSGGQITVVSNFFTGPHAMQTFNAFSQPQQKWLAPLVTSRLANGLSAPIAVQNLSGGQIPANAINVSCSGTHITGSTNSFSMTNPAPVVDSAAVYFNPVIDTTNFPDQWYGSCVVDTAGYDTVAFIQLRFIGQDRAAAYEAIPASGTNQKVLIPLVAKILGNSFATAVTIQNLNTSAGATVNLEYIPAAGVSGGNVQIPNQSIPAGESLIQNHRIASGPNSVPQLSNGWYGTLVVTSNQPIEAFVQLDFLDRTAGDPFMAHNAFSVTE